MNLGNVGQIIIGFGTPGNRAANDGTVYFDDIRLYKEFPPRQHSAKVVYNGSRDDIRENWWHVWNIPFADFNDMNMANVRQITIGFGDENRHQPAASDGIVYFDDISLGNGEPAGNDPYDQGSVVLFDDPFTFGVCG